MKSKEVLRILGVTLMNLVKKGKIHVTKLPNNYYEYLDEDVYAYAGLKGKEYQVIYARVSTTKQKKS